eukprot:m.242179 g.242179  ORF g.242179 m.242179 type:complete len:493 (+) comp25327_c0_seq1:149-1627(+)
MEASASGAYVKCYSATCKSSRTTTRAVDSESLDDASVFELEIHYLFPFSLLPGAAGRVSTGIAARVVEDVGHLEKRFGNDGHLLFSECVRTLGVESTETSDASSPPARSHAYLMNNFVASAGLTVTLSDAKGRTYTLSTVLLREFRFRVGILRFVVRADGPVDVQAVLGLQNGIMRLTEKDAQVRDCRLRGSDGSVFQPMVFVSGLLDAHYGPGHWKADGHTDRLFVYTVAAIAGTTRQQDLLRASYAIGQMEWTVPGKLDDDVAREFQGGHLYLRFASHNGGLWTSFHRDGGSTILFAEPGDGLHTGMFGAAAAASSPLVFGTTRPLAALSLAECILFQRTFLRDIDNTIHDLILKMRERSARKSIAILKDVHSHLLQFRAEFSTKPVSSSSSCEKQFKQWARVAALESTRDRLDTIVKDLHTYFADISGARTQSRLNALTIVLGFLGLAQLINGIYVSYADSGDKERIWLQVVIACILIVIASAFMRYNH